jgi:hypothetical protein
VVPIITIFKFQKERFFEKAPEAQRQKYAPREESA